MQSPELPTARQGRTAMTATLPPVNTDLRPASLRLRAFGPLRIERDGVTLGTVGRAQRKPLDLLALLVAHGGRPLEVPVVIDALWPSLDANAPRASMSMAVTRLRRLLGAPTAVRLAEGRLSLDTRQVWTDVAAFETQADAAERGDVPAALAAIDLYRDALLGCEPLSGRLLARRQQLALRFGLLVQAAGSALLAQGQAVQASRLYQRALCRDPLSESLHRALIGTQIGLGERAEALRSFQRCHDILQALLGVAPAPATLALVQQARSVAGVPEAWRMSNVHLQT
jgi:LuxR family maltose regulon positive regulatory protein